MSFPDIEARRARRAEERRRRARHRRFVVLGMLGCVLLALAVLVINVAGGGGSGASRSHPTAATSHRGHRTAGGGLGASAAAKATGKPGTQTVPILMYHVINAPPAGAPFPGLYVPADEFAAQMQALKTAGWHAVTLDQLQAYWTHGVPLGPGKPIVLTFDNGYLSQYSNAMPVLKRLGWPAVENIQLSGLPPSQGGLTDDQVRGLLSAGWELDTQGISHADLITLDAAQLHYQIATARAILRRRFDRPVNWFCYPSGHYDPTVIQAVRSAGYVGSTTVIPGWAGPGEDRYRLPRLRVLGGTSSSQLLSQIAQAQSNGPAPGAYSGGSAA